MNRVKKYLNKFVKQIIDMRLFSFSLGLIFCVLYFILSAYIIYAVKLKVIAGTLSIVYFNELILVMLTFSVLTIISDIGKVIEFSIYRGFIQKYINEINKYFPKMK